MLSDLSPMKEAREDFAIALDQSTRTKNGFRLFAIGGFNIYKNILSSIEMFDYKKNKWQIVANLTKAGGQPLGIRAHQAIALPDAIYIIGGFDGKNYLNSMIR